MKHYDLEISRFIDNELSANEQRELFSHLSNCEDCREIISDFMEMKRKTVSYYNNLSIELKTPVKLLASDIKIKKLHIYKHLFYLNMAASIILVLFILLNIRSITGLKESGDRMHIDVIRRNNLQNTMPTEVQKKVSEHNNFIETVKFNKTKKNKIRNYNFAEMQTQYSKSIRTIKTINLTSADIKSN
jgi:hypothetical protein